MTRRFILASSSPRRRELLARLGIDFDIIKPDVDETRHPGEDPFDYAARLSRTKAEIVAQQARSDAAVLAADTVVVLAADTVGVMDDAPGEILGKPADADEARAMLRRLRGRAHTVCTAFTLRINGGGPGQTVTHLERTLVYMRAYTDAEIDAYIATGDPFDKAGSYAIQHEGFHPVDRIEGDYDNVVGLPLAAVRGALVELDWPVGS